MFEISVLSIFFMLMFFVNLVEILTEGNEMKEKIRTVIAEYDGDKRFTSTTEQLMESSMIYAGGIISGCWYKKIKGQVLFEYKAHGESKKRFVLFDSKKLTYDEYLALPEIENFFMNKIFLI